MYDLKDKIKIFKFKNNKILLLNISRSDVFEIDKLFYDILNLPENSENEIIDDLKNKYSINEIRETLNKVKVLKKQILFSTNRKQPTFNHNKITMMINHDCNLKCKYCIGCGGRNYFGKYKYMNFTVAKKIIDFVVSRLKEETKRVIISFTCDGEPILNYNLIKKIKEYCKKIEKKGGNKFRFEFTFATNATLLNDEIIDELSSDERQKVFFSIDGPPEIHDNQRPFPNGRGTYDIAMKNIKKYAEKIEGKKLLSCTTVLTPLTSDFSKVLKHIVDLGFTSLVMRPIRGPKEWDFSLNEGSIKIFKRGYKKMANFLLETIKNKDYKYIEAIANPYDFFGKFFIHLLRNDKKFFGCPGYPPEISDSKNFCLVFDTNGDIYYPCRDFVGNPQFRIGNAFDKIDEDKINNGVLSMHVENKETCKNCWARYLCGGGCSLTTYFSTGDVKKSNKTICELIKYLIKLNMELVVSIKTNNPDLIEKLCSHASQDSPYNTVGKND